MKGNTSLGVAAANAYETSYALALHPFAWVSDSLALARTVLRGSPEGAPGESKLLLTRVWDTFGPGSTACTTARLVSEVLFRLRPTKGEIYKEVNASTMTERKRVRRGYWLECTPSL